MIKEDHTNSARNNSQKTSTTNCSRANSFLKILTKFVQNPCEETRFLGDLHIRRLNFPTGYISF